MDSWHILVEEIDICEIDEIVIEVSKQYFLDIFMGFDDASVRVNVGDGVAFFRDSLEGIYGVIIVDSFDPISHADELFKKPFFELVGRDLRLRGLVYTQEESIWL